MASAEIEQSIARQQERAAWRPRLQSCNEHLYARQNADHNSHLFLWDDHLCHQARLELERSEREHNRAGWEAHYASAVL